MSNDNTSDPRSVPWACIPELISNVFIKVLQKMDMIDSVKDDVNELRKELDELKKKVDDLKEESRKRKQNETKRKSREAKKAAAKKARQSSGVQYHLDTLLVDPSVPYVGQGLDVESSQVWRAVSSNEETESWNLDLFDTDS